MRAGSGRIHERCSAAEDAEEAWTFESEVRSKSLWILLPIKSEAVNWRPQPLVALHLEPNGS